MSRSILVLTVLLSASCYAQTADIIKIESLRSLLAENNGQIQIMNFWATWCGPCVKELPLFEALNSKNDPSIKVTLISLDFADEIEKVNAFVKRKGLKSQVLLLDEIDYNSWIDLVEKSWGGAIPATLVINQKTGQRKFVDRELKDGDLERMIVSLTHQ